MVDWDEIKKPLIGAAALVAIAGGAYLYIISGGSGGKGLCGAGGLSRAGSGEQRIRHVFGRGDSL